MSPLIHRFIHACEGRSVTSGSALRALVAGALTGGILTTAAASLSVALSTGFASDSGGIAGFAIAAAAMSAGWATGLGLVGAPSWWLLHRLKLRCWSAAMALGALLAPLPFVLLLQNNLWPAWLLLSGVGALVGLTVWLVAYRKPASGEGCAV